MRVTARHGDARPGGKHAGDGRIGFQLPKRDLQRDGRTTVRPVCTPLLTHLHATGHGVYIVKNGDTCSIHVRQQHRLVRRVGRGHACHVGELARRLERELERGE